MKFDELATHDVAHEAHISDVLDQLARHQPEPWDENFRSAIAKGIAFITFAFDIDGVSMEIAKYARCFEAIAPGIPVHCIAGNFGSKVDAVLDPDWHRFVLDGADGWDKWDSGIWFTQLFYEDLPPSGERTSALAIEMWNQALALAERLIDYIETNNIRLLFNVNTNSNPGNVAFGLALVLAAETTGVVVINNNHDFYWEGGKAGCKRDPGEQPGPRDHFFRNHDNEEFFGFFQRIFPWNGHRWAQVNINSLQARRLIDRFHFRPDHVFTIGTGLDHSFFRQRTPEVTRRCRLAMSQVLGGDPVIIPTPIKDFTADIPTWLSDQRPVVCGDGSGRPFDMTSSDALVLLQPTRIVERKRIWKDWELIGALLRHQPFLDAFEQRPALTVTLHITGPAPIEHRECLERVVEAYQQAIDGVSADVSSRVFLALSAGWQSHPKLDEDIDIVDIYQLADLVVFPSQTEGRGLPIIEAAAAGVPIICSRYEPDMVFSEVVGEQLGEDRLDFEQFPEGDIGTETLDRVSELLLDPNARREVVEHNREAVAHRYSLGALQHTLDDILSELERTVKGH